MTEIAGIQEEIKAHLQQSMLLHRSNRNKRTLSEAERETAEFREEANNAIESSAAIQVQRLNRVDDTLEPSEPGESATDDESFEVDVSLQQRCLCS